MLWPQPFESGEQKSKPMSRLKTPAAAVRKSVICSFVIFPGMFYEYIIKNFLARLPAPWRLKQSPHEYHTHSSRGVALSLLWLHSFESYERLTGLRAKIYPAAGTVRGWLSLRNKRWHVMSRQTNKASLLLLCLLGWILFWLDVFACVCGCVRS